MNVQHVVGALVLAPAPFLLLALRREATMTASNLAGLERIRAIGADSSPLGRLFLSNGPLLVVMVIVSEILLLFRRGLPPAARGILPFLIVLKMRAGISGLSLDHPDHERNLFA